MTQGRRGKKVGAHIAEKSSLFQIQVSKWNLWYVSITKKDIAILEVIVKKSRIRETKNISTDADSRTDTIFERLHDLSF